MAQHHDAYGSSSDYEFSRSQEAFSTASRPNSVESYSRDRYGSVGRHARQEPQGAPVEYTSPALSADASQYSRYNTSQAAGSSSAQFRYDNMYADLARTKRKRSLGKRIACVFGCLILALVLAGGGYTLWFAHALDSALASNEDDFADLSEVLVPAEEGEPYYVLIMGSDSREGNYSAATDQQGTNERSDVMILARIDARDKKITLLTIPRDTPYRLSDGSFVKINQMYNYEGAAGAVKAVSELTGLPISHHATIRISGLENIVNLLGGITVDVPVDLSYVTTDNQEVTIHAGRQTLNGQEAQIFARARHEFGSNQDEQRQSNVRQLMTAIIDKILDRPLPEIPNLVLKLAEYIDTDLRSKDAASLAMAFAGGDVTIYTGTGPSDGSVNDQAGEKWLCYQNPEGWKKVVAIVDAGEEPGGIDYAETQIPWSEVEGQPNFENSLAYHYYYGAHRDENGEWVYGKATSEPSPNPDAADTETVDGDDGES